MRLKFVPAQVFVKTPQVSFFDAGVKGSNGSDVVIHNGNAISPPNDGILGSITYIDIRLITI